MVEKIFTDRQTGKTYDRDRGVNNIANNEYLKPGTKRNPARVYVQTEERKKEVAAVFQENNWAAIINVASDRAEDISSLEILLNPVKTTINEHNIGRNDPCYCGSGKKYKKCCRLREEGGVQE